MKNMKKSDRKNLEDMKDLADITAGEETDGVMPAEDAKRDVSPMEQFRTLVLKRDRLKKEEELIHIEYIQKFGDMIQQLFALRIECVKYKKSIAYCLSCMNRSEPIYADQLETCVEDQISGYYKQLASIKAVAELQGEPISETDRLKVKRIYKEIALMIHPDMHPDTEFSKEMQDLWERAKDAYHNNDLEDIMETKVLVLDLLKKEPTEDKDVDEEYLEGRIKALNDEIRNIMTNNPYRYKDILEDEEAVEDRMDEYKDEIADAQAYLETLKAKFAEFEITEVFN